MRDNEFKKIQISYNYTLSISQLTDCLCFSKNTSNITEVTENTTTKQKRQTLVQNTLHR